MRRLLRCPAPRALPSFVPLSRGPVPTLRVIYRVLPCVLPVVPSVHHLELCLEAPHPLLEPLAQLLRARRARRAAAAAAAAAVQGLVRDGGRSSAIVVAHLSGGGGAPLSAAVSVVAARGSRRSGRDGERRGQLPRRDAALRMKVVRHALGCRWFETASEHSRIAAESRISAEPKVGLW